MKSMITKMATLTLALALAVPAVGGEIIPYEREVDYASYIKYDRFLNAEVWTDDDEYYQGDNITISFRTNEDCYVAVYNIDTRGRVNLLYPTERWHELYVEKERIYTIPSHYDDYDLTVQGPDGMEFIQIVASRDPIIIPDWYNGSDLVCDDDPYDFMDYINATYFSCDHNCRRAFDVTSFVVKEWHDYYFRPVHIYEHNYHYDYWNRPFWDWGFYGAMYIDYPFGATIYIDGVYWGVAPLFIPRIYYGWHYVTIYDHYGYCWEDRVDVTRRKSIVLDETLIKTTSTVKSRFKEVQKQGYLNPAKNGYPDYEKQVTMKKTQQPIVSQSVPGSRYKIAEEKTVRSKYDGYSTSAKVSSDKTGSSYRGSGKSKSGNDADRNTRSTDYKTRSGSKSGSDYIDNKTTRSKSSGSSSKSGESSNSRQSDKVNKSGDSKPSSSSTRSKSSGGSSGSSKSSDSPDYRSKSTSSSGSTSSAGSMKTQSSGSRGGAYKKGK
nr:DUF4384 domain-containing protein [candidate division Zixibacteria bacterium]